MDKERTVIDQKLCDTVRMMMAGKDAKVSQVVELLGISQATVNRIRQAGYSMEQFNKDKSSRNERKKERTEQRAGNTLDTFFTKEAKEAAINMPLPETAMEPGAGQIPGQISMDLQPAEEQKQDMDDQTKMMRFFAGQIAKVTEKLDKLNDTMNQILRRMDK